MARKSVKKPPKTKKPRAVRKPKPRVPITNIILHQVKMKGKKFQGGGYERRWEDSTCEITVNDTTARFTVACQTVVISKLNLKKLGVGLFKVPDVISSLPKIDGLTWSSILTLEVPVKNGESTKMMSVATEKTNGAEFVVFSGFANSRYKFKVETDTFKELIEVINKNYEVVEVG